MPKLGMKPIRQEALVKATISEVAAAGSLDVTVGRIAGAAGVSPALAHHYFGGKDDLFHAAMRRILADYTAATRAALHGAAHPRARLEAVLDAAFAPPNFAGAVVSAWLIFYVQAQRDPAFRRLLRIYHRRLRSNLLSGLRPLIGPAAPEAAEALGAMIDGLYLRAALSDTPRTGAEAVAATRAVLNTLIEGAAR